MNFNDSAEVAEFRQQLRAWLAENKPSVPSSPTDDEYWAAQASWHQSLFDAGFFGFTWPLEYGGRGLDPTYEVALDEELAAAGAPSKPSLGYLVQGMHTLASREVCLRFVPPMLSGRERWCQGFSEPDAGSDLASLRTTAVLDGDEYVINGHKIWTSYSDVADWCLLLARTDADVAKHRGISAFAVPMDQPGIEQRPIKMINGVSNEFGQVEFAEVRVDAANMIGGPGDGWRLAMTILAFEREPAELGYAARYRKVVNKLNDTVSADPAAFRNDQQLTLAWAQVQVEMLEHHVARRLSERMDGAHEESQGSIDKLLMTLVEQAVGHASIDLRTEMIPFDDDTSLKTYLYSRAQSVMGGTSEIQKNILAGRVLNLPNE